MKEAQTSWMGVTGNGVLYGSKKNPRIAATRGVDNV